MLCFVKVVTNHFLVYICGFSINPKETETRVFGVGGWCAKSH